MSSVLSFQWQICCWKLPLMAGAVPVVIRGPGRIRRELLCLSAFQAVPDVRRGRHAEVLPEDTA